MANELRAHISAIGDLDPERDRAIVDECADRINHVEGKLIILTTEGRADNRLRQEWERRNGT